MPKGSAYEDLMRSVDKYERSGAGANDRERGRQDAEEKKRKEKEEAERVRREAEKAGFGARVKQGFDNYRDMRDAVNSERPRGAASDDLLPKKKNRAAGGVRG